MNVKFKSDIIEADIKINIDDIDEKVVRKNVESVLHHLESLFTVYGCKELFNEIVDMRSDFTRRSLELLSEVGSQMGIEPTSEVKDILGSDVKIEDWNSED